jgi:hypothetical protein
MPVGTVQAQSLKRRRSTSTSRRSMLRLTQRDFVFSRCASSRARMARLRRCQPGSHTDRTRQAALIPAVEQAQTFPRLPELVQAVNDTLKKGIPVIRPSRFRRRSSCFIRTVDRFLQSLWPSLSARKRSRAWRARSMSICASATKRTCRSSCTSASCVPPIASASRSTSGENTSRSAIDTFRPLRSALRAER